MTDKYQMDGHKLYWHLDRLKEWQDNMIVPPIYVEISPVSYCNHKCIFCGVDFAMQKNMQLDTETICKRLREMGRSGVKGIMFAGEGEPILHRDLPQMVSAAKDSGMDVSISTNGTSGNYNLWENILPHLTWIRFSVDAGTSEIYSKIHNVTGVFFDKTLKSIKEAVIIKKENNLEVTIGVQFLIIEENLEDVRNAMDLYSSLGIDYIVLKPYSLHPQMLNKKDTIYTEYTINLLQEITSEYRDKKGSNMNIIFRDGALKRYKNSEKDFKHCNALPFWGYITTKGDFYTCSVFIGDERFRAGNIYENGMEAIFGGGNRRKSIELGRNGLIIEDECRVNCRMARVNEFLEFLSNKPEHVNFI